MHEIVNKVILADDKLKSIRIKIHSTIQKKDIKENELALMEYLDVVMDLSLIGTKSNEHFINEHVPDQGTLEVIENSVAEINNALIKSRLYDILQVNKKNKFINAKFALQNYSEIANTGLTLSANREYLIRMILILKSLGKGSQPLLPFYFEYLRQHLIKSDIMIECYSVNKISKDIMGLHPPTELVDVLINNVNSAVEQFKNKLEFDHYRQCHEALSVLRPTEARSHALEAAYGYIMEADQFSLAPNASQHLIAALYKKALLRFQFMEIKGEQLVALENKLVKSQEASVLQGRLAGWIEPMKLKPNPHLKLPDFENVYQAVYWLVDIPLITKKKLVEDLNKKQNDFFHLQYMGSAMTDAKGNTIGISEDNSKLIYQDASLFRQVFCKSIIIKMYEHFSDNQAISEMEVYELIARSKFIPPERISIYTRGLYHGFCGNFLEAVHILVPQLENCLRHVLNTHGKITTKLAEVLQKEPTLQSYLNHLKSILHEDLIFELEGLLNESFGENLRNNLAHGLSETSIFNSHVGIHTWWLALKLSLSIEQYIIAEANNPTEDPIPL